jgi:hypothetical protein
MQKSCKNLKKTLKKYLIFKINFDNITLYNITMYNNIAKKIKVLFEKVFLGDFIYGKK